MESKENEIKRELKIIKTKSKDNQKGINRESKEP